jgi:DNA replication protein DnaC
MGATLKKSEKIAKCDLLIIDDFGLKPLDASFKKHVA